MKKMMQNLKIRLSTLFLKLAVNKYKYIHLMINDKFTQPYIDFINRNFDSKEHLFIYRLSVPYLKEPKGKNVFRANYSKLSFGKNNLKILCHSLFDSRMIDYMYAHPELLKNKAYWVIWGGCLYNAQRDEKNDFVRKNFKGYISVIKGDEEVAKRQYKSESLLFHAPYLCPMFEQRDYICEIRKHPIVKEHIKIQINNSSDESTLEMLDILSRFKDENIKIVTILSYGDLDFKEPIIQKGKSIYGEKFEYIDAYMNPKDFINHLHSNDILILNQNRQQGMGNVNASILLGKKVFIKSDITSVQHLKSIKVKVFNTYDIKNLSFQEFKTYDKEIKEENIKNFQKVYNESWYAKAWADVFTSKEKI